MLILSSTQVKDEISRGYPVMSKRRDQPRVSDDEMSHGILYNFFLWMVIF